MWALLVFPPGVNTLREILWQEQSSVIGYADHLYSHHLLSFTLGKYCTGNDICDCWYLEIVFG